MVLINELIGRFGKYHFWICFLIFINKFGVAFHHMAIIFLAPPVMYSCAGNRTECCDDPIYDTSLFTRTIVTEWNLICGKSWLKDLTQTLFQLGVLLGSLLFGIASDKWGRRPTMIVSVILEVLTGVIASFAPDYWTFTLVRLLLGFATGGVMVVGFVIVMEFAGNQNRDTISALYQICFAFGHMLLALFGYYLRDFTYFQLAISLKTVVLLIYICTIPETPRWLLAVNRTVDAIKLIKRVAVMYVPLYSFIPWCKWLLDYVPKYNDKTFFSNGKPTEDIEQKIEAYQEEHRLNREKKGSTIDLFRTPNLRRNIMIMSFNWLVCSYCFYGISQYVSHLAGNMFINVVASGFMEVLSVIISIPLMKFMGRRTLVIFCNVACSVCLFLLAVIPEGVGSTVLGCLGVLCSFTVFVVVYLYCSEMFPTVVRNAAIGISSMMARAGAMVAPFVAALRPHGQWCAPIAFGIFPLIAAVLCIFLPETKNCELMSTIQEGEEMGTRTARPAEATTT